VYADDDSGRVTTISVTRRISSPRSVDPEISNIFG
jgi:hypothetical protein